MSEEYTKITIGRFRKRTDESPSKKIDRILNTKKCVIHLIDFTPVHVAKIIALDILPFSIDETIKSEIVEKRSDTPKNLKRGIILDVPYTPPKDNNGYTDLNEDDDSGDYVLEGLDEFDEADTTDELVDYLRTLSSHDKHTLKTEYLKSLVDFITDQHRELWDIMKRGDIVEDISTTQFNDRLESIDDYSPTRGRYIVDYDNLNENPNDDESGSGSSSRERLSVAQVLRNGLTLRYLTVDDEPNKLTRHTPPKTMHTITDFPIGYFDDVEVNDILCPGEIPRSSWGGECSIFLDESKLKLNKLKKQNIKHVTRKTIRNNNPTTVDYLYTTITYNSVKYLLVSEYPTKPMKYNIDREKEFLIKKVRSGKHLDPYDRTKDTVVKSIATKEGVDIKNVLCV
ncbi:hypothetical protein YASMINEVIRUS_1024 [Yasminevirus sp. GU-2018]|uniref:Uncharacterized protein n=1 Tax=Yasminevirus sp. GU-2018 TaxID=2420051 RepID=A0A5K0UAD7_9VIRU|nr:hypothetical protein YASMINEVIRUS_1024 [Yasminevirus sp. GU-2018]